jgi:hypothetical protein
VARRAPEFGISFALLDQLGIIKLRLRTIGRVRLHRLAHREMQKPREGFCMARRCRNIKDTRPREPNGASDSDDANEKKCGDQRSNGLHGMTAREVQDWLQRRSQRNAMFLGQVSSLDDIIKRRVRTVVRKLMPSRTVPFPLGAALTPKSNQEKCYKCRNEVRAGDELHE